MTNFLQSYYYTHELYHLNLLVLNLIIYCITLLFFFSLFFLFKTNNFKTLSDFKLINQNPTLSILSVLFIFFLAGIPPFLSFAGKFLLFVYFFKKNNYLLLLLFFLFNSFVIFFYIQNLKLLITKKKQMNNIYTNFKVYWNTALIKYIISLTFFLITGVFFISDFFLFTHSMFIEDSSI